MEELQENLQRVESVYINACWKLSGLSQEFVFLESKGYCGGLTMAGCQMATQLLSHSLSLTGQGEEMRLKSLRFKVKTGRSYTNYHQKQNRLDMGKINLIYIQLKIQ